MVGDGHEPGCGNAAPPGLGCGCGLLRHPTYGEDVDTEGLAEVYDSAVRCTTFGLALDRDGAFLLVEWVRENALRLQASRRGRDRTGAVKAFLGVDAAWRERVRALNVACPGCKSKVVIAINGNAVVP